MKNSKSTTIPISGYEKISSEQETKFPCREVVGRLLYLSNRTRPDISYAVSYCSRNMGYPTKKDIKNVKRVMHKEWFVEKVKKTDDTSLQ